MKTNHGCNSKMKSINEIPSLTSSSDAAEPESEPPLSSLFLAWTSGLGLDVGLFQLLILWIRNWLGERKEEVFFLEPN